MGMKRALTMGYHPQANGQMEIMNQTLEISLRAYVGPNRDNWVSSLNGLSLSYNSTPHTATGFTPAYLLRGYVPVTSSNPIHSPENFTQSHQNLGHWLNMPIQSRLLPLDSYSGLDIVPFVAFQYILENSPLTMSLQDHHLHRASATKDLFSINFKFANALWFILKDLSHTIQLAANPLLDPFSDLLGTLDPKLLEDIDMPFPTILTIENYTQNLLIMMSTQAELEQLFSSAQKIGLAGAQWIQEARE
jgi:hypothetical protein